MASRKRRVITLDQKLKIIDDLKEGKSQRLVGDIHGVPKSTVGDIWKDREKIEKYVSTSDCPTFAKKRCIVREAKFEELEKACYTWFMQQRSKGAPVSGPLLKEKALQLFPSIYPESSAQSFVASSGWLSNFISRHGIRGISLQGESLSADTSAVDSFQSELHQRMKTALKWLEGQSDTDPFHLLLVRKWRDTAAQKRVQTLKQTTLLSYLA